MDTISHYRILQSLGAGGMGEVYLAEDMKLGRKIAIKVLREEFTTNRDRLQRFEQEASAASALNHPNILTIHEVGHEDGRHFIATEYIDGITLRQKLAVDPFDTREVLDIAVQIASALEEAHAAGIIHRDVKPDNVMVRKNGYVKVLDFGLAKLTEDTRDRSSLDAEASTRVMVQTDAGVVMGTSHYMSPEQARGKPVDARSDIWSLGVVLYEMVAGRTPFEGETSTDVIVSITQREPPPLIRFAPQVPAELDWIVTKALRKDREERYQTVKELLTDLRRLKQRLEFEIELERSATPESFTRSGFAAAPAAPTISERALPTVEKTLTHVSSAEYIVTGLKQHKVAVILIALLLVAGAGVGGYLYKYRKAALTDKDTVLLTDFVNTTGEAVFDGTLKQALSIQLGQTPFLNIYPEERVRETLRFMGRSPDDRITRDVGREICARQGLKALLSGSIASLGSHYVITLEAINAQTGDPIAREQIEAESKEKVLSALGTATSSLREKLGESLSSIKKYDVAIEQATTSSLEALKAFSQGNEARASGRAQESLGFYEQAIKLDPNFAMAYARIAVYYGNRQQTDLARQYVEKAFELRDRVSEREKLYISEKYYNYVTGELDKTTEVLQTWASQYPNDYIPHNNLALNYMYIGRFEDAMREALKAVELSPQNVSSRDNLIASFIALGRLDEAEQATNELDKISPNTTSVMFNRYGLAFLRGDQAAMTRVIAGFQGKPEEAEALSATAATAAFQGKLKESESQQGKARDLFRAQHRTENVAQSISSLALRQAALGKCPDAKRNIASSLSLDRGRISLANAGQVMAVCNDVAQTQSIINELQKSFQTDTVINRLMVPTITAILDLHRGDAGAALQTLDTLRPYDMGFLMGSGTVYIRGQAYLKQKMGQEAAAEFKRIIDKPGIDSTALERPLAYVGLARASVLSGDTAAARKAYQDFLALWKDADSDLVILQEARKEYEQLK
jgi:eukaryotic-like serine/threonine-protein kinase